MFVTLTTKSGIQYFAIAHIVAMLAHESSTTILTVCGLTYDVVESRDEIMTKLREIDAALAGC